MYIYLAGKKNKIPDARYYRERVGMGGRRRGVKSCLGAFYVEQTPVKTSHLRSM